MIYFFLKSFKYIPESHYFIIVFKKYGILSPNARLSAQNHSPAQIEAAVCSATAEIVITG